MTRSRHAPRLSSGFYLGGQQAEADPLLEDAFDETNQYKAVSSRDDHRCFIIGRTGSGKSALLRRLEYEYPDHVIRISPEDLSLTYVADLQSVRWLSEHDVHLDPFFIALSGSMSCSSKSSNIATRSTHPLPNRTSSPYWPTRSSATRANWRQ